MGDERPATAMNEPRLNSVQCLSTRGLHRMAYWEWGDATNPRVLVCAHGLARQGRDFDTLARSLCGEYRVVCPDVVGRGQSDALADPVHRVCIQPRQQRDHVGHIRGNLVAHRVGTSMGGLIGLGLASLPKTPVARLVMNDVGPTIQAEALRRIGSYLGAPVRWNTLEEAADYMLSISKGFGPHTREQWLALTRPMLKADGDGFKPHYDPNIAQPFKAVTPEMAAAGEAFLWHSYDAVRCPTLLLRGADSDLLTRETAQAMTQRGPKARLVEFAGVGHAPTLVVADQVDVVRGFLLAP
jgi:pimeloyl-ACP methyl ester carboxylesterase